MPPLSDRATGARRGTARLVSGDDERLDALVGEGHVADGYPERLRDLLAGGQREDADLAGDGGWRRGGGRGSGIGRGIGIGAERSSGASVLVRQRKPKGCGWRGWPWSQKRSLSVARLRCE